MSDVKTTVEHRQAALAAWNGPTPSRAVLAVNDVVKPWLETGVPARDGSPMCNLEQALQRIAESIATAEHRVRAAVIADLRGLLERAPKHEESWDSGGEYVEADSIRNLIETLEAANG